MSFTRSSILVARREALAVLRRPSFYLTLLAGPLLSTLVFLAIGWITTRYAPDTAAPAPAQAVRPAGYVDPAGIVKRVPADLQSIFVRFPTREAAAAALAGGRVDSYFVLAPDYRSSGAVVRWSDDVSYASAGAADTRAFIRLLRTNLADERLATRLDTPLPPDAVRIEQAPGAPGGDMARGKRDGLAVALGMLLAFSILNGGGWLLRALSEERSGKTIEILLTSIRPSALLSGKLLGLGGLSLLQMGAWIALSRAVLRLGRATGQVSAAAVSPALWGWMLAYFVLGFFFVGSMLLLLGGLGATGGESGQINALLTAPLLLPLALGQLIADAPDGRLAELLSIFPPTAPAAMILRLQQGPVALTQTLGSLALMLICTLSLLALAARSINGAALLERRGKRSKMSVGAS